MMRLLFVFFILLIINFNANSSEYEWHKIIVTKEGNIFFVDMNSGLYCIQLVDGQPSGRRIP